MSCQSLFIVYFLLDYVLFIEISYILSVFRNSAAESSSRVSHSGNFAGRTKLVHEEVALQWAVATNPFKEMAMAHAWFYFDIMVTRNDYKWKQLLYTLFENLA